MAKPLSYYREYEPLSHDEVSELADGLLRIFDSYTEHVGISGHDIVYSKGDLSEIVERVDKRKVYFRVFYGKEMSERNEVSLYCFWILKLSPFFDVSNPDIRVNVNFAIYFLLKLIQYISMKSGKRITFTHEYVVSLKYAFAFRDISKEAIMAMVETISGTLFIE
jgi:hypothetical protein